MPARECGPCSVCCTFARVPEFNKAERVRCSELCETGCRIYLERPASCALFRCAWLAGAMGEEDRPDLSGVMVEDFGSFLFAMSEGGEWRTMAALDEFVREGRPVVIGSRQGNGMLLPPGDRPERVLELVQGALNGRR